MPKPSQISSRRNASDSEHQQPSGDARAGSVETVPRRRRRTFSAADKLSIVKEAERCLAGGKRGALEAMLRRNGIYSSQLATWRAQLDARGAEGLAARKPGRKAKLTDVERRNAELMKRNAELERKLHIAHVLIELQKKTHEVLGLALPETDGES